MNISASNLIDFAGRICQSAGANVAEATQVATLLVEANLQGHDSHGVGMLPIYVRNINKGFLNPAAHIKEISRSGSVLLLDGQSGFGQVVGPEAMQLAIEHAATEGVSLMGLRNAHHLGRIGGLAEQVVAAGFISLHYVNVVGHKPLVAPFGGRSGRMNTNPFCCGIPMDAEHESFIFDMATSTIALGKARVAHNKSESVANGCLVDYRGNPTNDPGVMFSEPMGALTYIGNHKGYGLALVCELLAGALVGNWTAQDEHPRPLNVINHMLSVVIDPTVFGDLSAFREEAGKLVDYIKATEPAGGTEKVLIPGDPERRTRNQRIRDGIPIDPTTWQQLLQTASQVGLSEAECEAFRLG